MKSPTTIRQGVTLLVLAWAALAAQAAPTIYEGYDPGANGVLNSTGAPVAARTDFLARLSSSTTETFGEYRENAQLPEPPLSIFAGAADLSQDTGAGGRVENRQLVGVEFPGRFNTSPDADADTATLGAWWQSTGQFTIKFVNLISAFGFFATDMGDFDGTLTLDLLRGTDSVATGIVVGTTILNAQNPSAAPPNAALLFFGYVDDQAKFDTIVFNLAQSSTDPSSFDSVGFDDLLTGPLTSSDPNGNGNGNGTVPEPGTLALAGLSLLGLAAARRRRA